jgi:von willebrand factor type A domain protein
LTQEQRYNQVFLPVFFLVDVSFSMEQQQSEGGTLLDAVNNLIPDLVEACEKHPTLDQKLRIGLIKFSDTASVSIPLSESDDFSHSIPRLTPEGGTNFAAAFETIFKELTPAIEAIKGPGIGVYRPTVFFITDGEDIGDKAHREQAWAALSSPSFRYKPNFFTFGVSEAHAADIQQFHLGSGFTAVTRDANKAMTRLSEILNTLVQSIVASSVGDDPTGSLEVKPDDFDPDVWDTFV